MSGKTKPKERERVLRDFRRGRLDALVSCEVLTEGYDESRVSCVVMARPTASRGLYYQCVGRGMRIDPASGKSDCLVLDVIDRGARSYPVVASDLFGARVPDCNGEDIRVAAEREKHRRRLHPISPRASLRAAWDLGTEEAWTELPSLTGYAATKPWQSRPATQAQLESIRDRFRFEIHRELTRGEASHLIDHCLAQDEQHPILATPGQAAVLSRYGLYYEGMTRREATGRFLELQATWISS